MGLINRKNIIIFSVFMITILCILVLPEQAKASEGNELMVVSLGDSYSSGEGLGDFYGEEKKLADKVKDPDWLAHRSRKAWPGQLKDQNGNPMKRGENWFFAAASGATTYHLDHKQKKEANKLKAREVAGGSQGFDRKNMVTNKDKKWERLSPQKTVFDDIEKNGQTVDYVTATIGGNDMNFTQIMIFTAVDTSFFFPNLLNARLQYAWVAYDLGTVHNSMPIKERIENAYLKMAKYAGKDANIIIAGYPELLAKDGDNVFFSRKEAILLDANVELFNTKLHQIVKKCRKENNVKIHFVPVAEAFKKQGDGAYSSNKGNELINRIMGLKAEDIDETGFPISAYSFHPNDKGSQIYADCVQEKINELEAKKPAEEEAETEQSVKPKVVGSWYWAGSGATPPIKLREDGVLEIEEGIGEWEERGTWKCEGNKVYIIRDGSEEVLEYNAEQDALGDYRRMVNGGFQFFETINEIGHSFGDIENNYNIEETEVTDEWHLYSCLSASFEFSFSSTNTEMFDNGLGDSWEIPAPPKASDQCMRMSGTAVDLLDIHGSTSIKQFQKENDRYLTSSMKSGSGNDLDTGAYSGLVSTIKLSNGKRYHILFKDIDLGDNITPDTMVYIEDVDRIRTPSE